MMEVLQVPTQGKLLEAIGGICRSCYYAIPRYEVDMSHISDLTDFVPARIAITSAVVVSS
jgi:hypothetical protein